jgi:hypothetical protein
MVGARAASIIGTDREISDLVTDRLYFTSVDLVRDGDRCVLDPDLAGAFTHVAARAADENAFLELIADAAKQLGLIVHDVEWMCGTDCLSRRQVRYPESSDDLST